MTNGAGLDNGGGSRIVLQDRGGDRRLHASGASTTTPGGEDGVEREYAPSYRWAR